MKDPHRERAGGCRAPHPGRRWGQGGQAAARSVTSPSPGACAGSWRVPTASRHVLRRAAGIGRNGQESAAGLPSFLMQFANGCEDVAKPEPERGRSRGAGGMREAERRHRGSGEPARISVAQLR